MIFGIELIFSTGAGMRLCFGNKVGHTGMLSFLLSSTYNIKALFGELGGDTHRTAAPRDVPDHHTPMESWENKEGRG